jgi:cytochrome c5
VLSALGVSALLTISGCSGGDNTAAPDEAVDGTSPVTEVETVVAEEQMPEAETVEAMEPIDETPVPAVTSEDIVEVDSAAEPEILAADAGAKLYEAQCKVCHQNGLLNAPKYGDKAGWAPHLAKDIETLYTHSAKGFNKMPAQANDKVSEAQVHAAVDYMVAAVS